MIEIRNINIQFDKPIITNGEIQIFNGELTGIVGPSGSGKTSLLYLIGLLSNQMCEYNYENHILSEKEKDIYRVKNISFVFQDCSLLNYMTIEDHFYLYAALAGVSITKNNIFEMLDSFNLADLKLDAKISDLSSGEKQRIAILLSTLKQPDILILDEPTSSLDKENAIAILEYIQNYVKRRNIKAVMAFHDPICNNYISSVYKIEKTKILKENSRAISEKYDKNNKISIKKSLSFYYSYFKNSLHYNFKRILFIILSIALGIGIGNFMNAFTNGIENTKIKLISDSFSKELLICKNNINELVYDLPYIDPIDENTISKLKNNKYIANIYEYCEQTITDSNGNLIILLPNYHDKRIMIDYRLRENDQLHFKYNGIEYDYRIDDFLKYGTENPYSSSNGYICYFPYEELKQISNDSSNLLIAEVNDIFCIESVSKQIQSIDQNLKVRYDQSIELNEAISSIHLLDNVLHFFSKSTLFLGVVFCGYFYNKIIIQRKKEIILLMANGLSKIELLILMIYEIIIYTLFGLFVSLLLFCFGRFLSKINGIIISIDLISYLVETMITILLILLPAMYLSYNSLSNISISDLIRKNVNI